MSGAACGPQTVDACGGSQLLFCSSCGADLLPEDGGVRCTVRIEFTDGGATEQTTRFDTMGFVGRADGGMELDLSALSVPIVQVSGAPGASALRVSSDGQSQVAPWSKALRAGDFIGLDLSATREGANSGPRASVRCVGRASVSQTQSIEAFCDGGCGNPTLLGLDGRYHEVSCGACAPSQDCIGVCGITCSSGSSWGSVTDLVEPLTLKFDGSGYTAGLGGTTLRTASPESGVVTMTFPFFQRGGGSGSGSATIDGGVIFLNSYVSSPLFYGSYVYASWNVVCRGAAHVVYAP